MPKNLSDQPARERYFDVVAGNRRLWRGPHRRMLLFKWVLCLGLLAELSLCPRLWVTVRSFPTVPALPGLPSLPQLPCLIVVWLLVLAIVAIGVLPRSGPLAFAVPALGVVLVLFDITRLQPWFYQSMLLFAALGLGDGRERLESRPPTTWAICGFILAATYVWSGLQKVNMSFADHIFPWLLHPLGLGRVSGLWLLAPVLETSIGVLLLLPRTRTTGLGVAVAMHGFLLVALGPFGQNFNSGVWPWNLEMPCLAFALFYRNAEPLVSSVWQTWLGRAGVVLVGILPALNFVGWWDDSLSASLYSGKTREAFILMNEDGARRLRADVQPYVQRRSDRIGLDIQRWALADLSVPPYPELRVFKAVALRLIESGVPADDLLSL